jgi:hypothetical protein
MNSNNNLVHKESQSLYHWKKASLVSHLHMKTLHFLVAKRNNSEEEVDLPKQHTPSMGKLFSTQD